MTLKHILLTTILVFFAQLACFMVAGGLGLPEESVGWMVAPGVWLGDWLVERTGAIDIATLPYVFGAIGVNMILNGLVVSLLVGACRHPKQEHPPA